MHCGHQSSPRVRRGRRGREWLRRRSPNFVENHVAEGGAWTPEWLVDTPTRAFDAQARPNTEATLRTYLEERHDAAPATVSATPINAKRSRGEPLPASESGVPPPGRSG